MVILVAPPILPIFGSTELTPVKQRHYKLVYTTGSTI